MKILVAVKQVAALDEDFEIRADGKDVEADFLLRDLNEWDDFALEEAVRIKEASAGTPVEVVVVSVGPEEADETLRKCLAKGADRAIRVWEEAIAGSDPIAIARVLAAVARREAPDLLFAGAQSSDHAFAATGIAATAAARLAARGRGDQLKYAPGRRTRQVPARAGRRAAARDGNRPAGRADHSARYQHSALCVAARHQAGGGQTDRGALAGRARRCRRSSVGRGGSPSRVRRMYIPEKSRARMLEGSVEEQARQRARDHPRSSGRCGLSGILIIAEHRRGELRPATLELVTAAQGVLRAGDKVTVALIGRIARSALVPARQRRGRR